jgi:hypothetical protein
VRMYLYRWGSLDSDSDVSRQAPIQMEVSCDERAMKCRDKPIWLLNLSPAHPPCSAAMKMAATACISEFRWR